MMSQSTHSWNSPGMGLKNTPIFYLDSTWNDLEWLGMENNLSLNFLLGMRWEFTWIPTIPPRSRQNVWGRVKYCGSTVRSRGWRDISSLSLRIMVGSCSFPILSLLLLLPFWWWQTCQGSLGCGDGGNRCILTSPCVLMCPSMGPSVHSGGGHLSSSWH